MDACLHGLPRTIKIGAYDWKVVFDESDPELYGQADFEYRCIRICPSNLTAPSHCVGIVLHECLHVIFDNHGLGILRRDKEEREEQIVLAYENGLVALFRDNPKLTNWIRKWIK